LFAYFSGALAEMLVAFSGLPISGLTKSKNRALAANEVRKKFAD
jgi:hypothetical protein